MNSKLFEKLNKKKGESFFNSQIFMINEELKYFFLSFIFKTQFIFILTILIIKLGLILSINIRAIGINAMIKKNLFTNKGIFVFFFLF